MTWPIAFRITNTSCATHSLGFPGRRAAHWSQPHSLGTAELQHSSTDVLLAAVLILPRNNIYRQSDNFCYDFTSFAIINSEVGTIYARLVKFTEASWEIF